MSGIGEWEVEQDLVDLELFRQEVRQFVHDHLPSEMRSRALSRVHPPRDDMLYWTGVLNSKGWSAPHWPVEYGGTGWSPLKRMAFDIELAESGAPPVSPFGIHLIGPVLCEFGTDWQKRRFLPPILDGSEFWCQGYSEPNSGSDLASLRTTAARVGEQYIVNGQKIWTGGAHFADMIFCLVRTDNGTKKQSGISMLLIDMKSHGVSVKPIITLDMDHYVNEVFFDDVSVPSENLIGEQGHGWTYAKFLLENERTSSAYLPETKRDLKILHGYLQHTKGWGNNGAHDVRFDMELAQLEVEIAALEMMIYRILAGAPHVQVGASASMIKIKGAQLRQKIAALQVEAIGASSLLVPGFQNDETITNQGEAGLGAMAHFLFRRAVSIYGGTNEIQHNIIAKKGLGL
jgi:alkylation response protein AidB-like acyl-CoA dehydrogenase